MKLAGLTLPLPYETACQYGLVFAAALAARLREVQGEHGDQRHRVEPQATADGRYFLNGDVLSEVGPGGIFSPAFSRLDASRFDEIEVMPIADAMALLPVEPSPFV